MAAVIIKGKLRHEITELEVIRKSLPVWNAVLSLAKQYIYFQYSFFLCPVKIELCTAQSYISHDGS